MEKKEVKKRGSKDNFNLTILNLLNQGFTPINISKKLNLSMPNLSYYLRNLKKQGCIKKVGYGTWEVKNLTLNIVEKKHKLIRGHAFIWNVKLNKEFKWLELMKDTSYYLVRGLTPRVFILGKKVWLGKKSITIYESNSFYGENSIESRKYAVIGLFEVLEALEKEFNINLRPYVFKPAKEHYSMIKNELARQYNRNNEKMIISDTLEGDWLWIDDSESLNELETKNIVRSKQVQDWWNDNKKHDFKVNATFINNGFAKTFTILDKLEIQIKSHLDLIQEYRKENIAWRKNQVKEIKKELKEGSQLTLGDF